MPSARIVKRLYSPVSSGLPYTADYENDFEAYAAGETNAGISNGSSSAAVSTEQAYSGTKSWKMTINSGSHSYGGSRRLAVIEPGQGDEIWWRIRTYFPNGFDFTAVQALKWMRLDNGPPGGAGHGAGSHTDMYLCGGGAGSGSTNVGFWNFIAEGTGANWVYPAGTSTTDLPSGIIRGQWQTWEYYVLLHATNGTVRFWRDNTLLMNVPGRMTLSSATAIIGNATRTNAAGFMKCTYWNWTGTPTPTQSGYVDDWKIATSITGRPTVIDGNGYERIGV